uniref:FLYWCH-type domain-containing protein n=1 Tax=Caenorhabditis tropicalis TaxID=1561998 RepID=A0A1I7U4U9_9PELO
MNTDSSIRSSSGSPEGDTAGPSAIPASPAAPIDLNTLIRSLQSNPAIAALLANGTNPNTIVSQLLGAVKGAGIVPKTEIGSPSTPSEKRTRLKVFSNGYFMTFDKISSCGNKHFWRCEYKNTCKARMHTDINSEKIVVYIHDHNHKPPTNEEVRLYGLDPIGYERNRVYVVGSLADPNLRRKIRKQEAERELAAQRLEQQKEEQQREEKNVAAIAAARALYEQALASKNMLSGALAPSSSSGAAAVPTPPQMNFLAQLPFLKQEMNDLPVPGVSSVQPVVPVPNWTSSSSLLIPKMELEAQSQPCSTVTPARPPAAKRKAVEIKQETEDNNDIRNDPLFRSTFEIAQKLRKLWKPVPSRYPRQTKTPSLHWEFYLSMQTDSEEHLYVLLRIERRDEIHLKTALQRFCGKTCVGMLLFGISPKISVILSQLMMAEWENNQFFLLDISNPTRWRLMYVDDQAN